MHQFHTFSVVPKLPDKLRPLEKLAFNLRWSWDSRLAELAKMLDSHAWEASCHNPVTMLGMVPQERLSQAAEDPVFIEHMETAYRELQDHLTGDFWFQQAHADAENVSIAYFSAEFGIAECLPIYSGGLGVLAGDHLKAASELGDPLVGVTLLYQKGYFRQYLNVDGWQQERYPSNDFSNLPINLMKKPDGSPVTISVDFPNRKVHAQVWEAKVGRVSLYMLDTNVALNDARDHYITNELYGGDQETRIQQEIMLGIGGTRALVELGISRTVYHMNEGHSAFLALERIRMLMQEKGISFDLARQITSAGNVFTTHTPVAAGFDVFHPAMMQVYFGDYAKSLGLEWEEFMALGRVDPSDKTSGFNMAVLAMKNSPYVNGVSKLHGQVSRSMVEPLWPGYSNEEIPVNSVTNGIHTSSWISADMARLFDEYLGFEWSSQVPKKEIWAKVDEIPDEELWAIHQRHRMKLVEFARKRMHEQLVQRNVHRREVDAAKNILNPEALTIGFARRFATYKRATLILSDPERLKKIISNTDRPVQFVFAGKAHPKDDAGKDYLRQIVHFAREESVRNHMVFLEDYDLATARKMVHGVDVWLNTPRRPMEASGTSGMKVVCNGGLNFSVLDGWWAEAYEPEVGWAIGSGEEYTDFAYQDRVEAQEMYELLEQDIVPLFYNRDQDDVPHEWIAKMKACMRKLMPVYSTCRMVREYTDRFYIPAGKRYQTFAGDDYSRAQSVVDWKKRIKANWSQVSVGEVKEEEGNLLTIGSEMKISAMVELGVLSPTDVSVEIYWGNIRTETGVVNGRTIRMTRIESKDGLHHYEGCIPCDNSGLHGYTIRVIPDHPDAVIPYDLNLITWE